jgi:tRNA threonylcarbamoyladenosine biosynthesis protein TsaE
VKLADEAAVRAIGAAIGRSLRAGDVIALAGELGAGKTTLVRGLLAGLGYEGDVPSPTFSIVQSYEPPATRLAVAHCDLYRLETEDEVTELGLEEMLSDGALLVEWPERAGGRWPDALLLTLAIDGDARRLTARAPTAWEGRWPPT